MKNVILSIVLFLIVGDVSGQVIIDTVNFSNWINEQSIELNRAQDFDKLSEFLKNKDVVGLGECVHGSKTINNVRIELAKSMIKNGGFRNVAFEMSFNTGLRINHYIQTGEGDIKKILKESHFFLNSKEMLDFVMWIKHFNNQNDKKVSLYGFDIQSNIDLVEDISSYCDKTQDDAAKDMTKDLIKIFAQNNIHSFNKYPSALKDSVVRIIDNLRKKYELNKKNYILKTDYIQFANNQKRIEVLSNHLKMVSGNYGLYSKVRDSCNAELVKWIKDFEGENSKIILFAHNGHLCFNTIYIPRLRTLTTEGFYQDEPKELFTGYYLKNIFGNSYYFIGTQFSTGYFMGFDPENKFQLSKLQVSSPEQYSFPHLLQQAKKSPYFLSFGFNSKTPRIVINYICSLQNIYSIGAAYDFKYAKARLIDYFDGVIFIDKIEESTILK